MFQHLLLAFDGSENARKAAQIAGQCARERGSTVRVVVAVDPIPADLGEPYFSRAASERSARGQQLLEEARELVGAKVDLHTELLFGPAAEEILSVAEVRQCDLIVMGSRGLSALGGLLLGSQTQKVISRAQCPVLVAR